MFEAAAIDMDRRSAVRQLAATLIHTVIGRVVALVVLEARAWDTGLENLWAGVTPGLWIRRRWDACLRVSP
jgi:hypothetical protein